MTVKEAINYLRYVECVHPFLYTLLNCIPRSRNPGEDMNNYGLFLPFNPSKSKVDGIFLDENRPMSSYELTAQVCFSVVV